MEDKKKLNEEFGEFVPTEFSWISLEKQKENANRLNNITKNKKEKNKNK